MLRERLGLVDIVFYIMVSFIFVGGIFFSSHATLVVDILVITAMTDETFGLLTTYSFLDSGPDPRGTRVRKYLHLGRMEKDPRKFRQQNSSIFCPYKRNTIG